MPPADLELILWRQGGDATAPAYASWVMAGSPRRAGDRRRFDAAR